MIRVWVPTYEAPYELLFLLIDQEPTYTPLEFEELDTFVRGSMVVLVVISHLWNDQILRISVGDRLVTSDSYDCVSVRDL